MVVLLFLYQIRNAFCINRKACAILTEGQKQNDAGHNQEVLDEEHDRPHEDVDAVGIFNNFHTSSNMGLSDVARETVVSNFICFS